MNPAFYLQTHASTPLGVRLVHQQPFHKVEHCALSSKPTPRTTTASNIEDEDAFNFALALSLADSEPKPVQKPTLKPITSKPAVLTEDEAMKIAISESLRENDKLPAINGENGFINNGNFCYLNAVLGVFGKTDIFKRVGQENDAKLVGHLSRVREITHSVDPELFADIINANLRQSKYSVHRQEDASEFLIDMFGVMDRESHALVERLFKFTFADSDTGNIEPSIISFLPLPFTLPKSLQEVFDLYATTVRFVAVGEYLIVSLKRFMLKNERILKNSVEITIPELISCSSFNEPIYLAPIAAIEHLGENVRSGHYVSYRKTPSSWIKTNDSATSNVALSDIKQPYIIILKKL